MNSIVNYIFILLCIILQLFTYHGYCADGISNVALGKQTYQSSKFEPSKPDAWISRNAVDGKIDGQNEAGTCTHTQSEAQTWWAIDLGHVYNIYNISIANRNCCTNRMRNFSIVATTDGYLLNKTNHAKLCSEERRIMQNGETKIYQCQQKPMEARYIIINKTISNQVESDFPLNICEVEIYAVNISTSTTASTTTISTTTTTSTSASTTTTSTTTTAPTTTTSTTASSTTTAATTITSTTRSTANPTTTSTTTAQTTTTTKPPSSTISRTISTSPVKSPPPISNPSGKTIESDVPIIAGATIGALVVIAIVIIVIVVLFIKRKRYSNKENIAAEIALVNGAHNKPDKPIIAVTPVVATQQSFINEEETTVHDVQAAGYSNVENNSTLVEVANIGAYVSNLKEQKKAFKDEYESLPNAVYPWDQCDTEELKVKNRYKNIYPYNNSRVLLKRLGENPLSTYINASFIKDYRGDVSYIAALGPTKYTIDDIWRMVWEQNVSLMVMVTTLVEDQKINCEQYWPAEGMFTYGDIKVTLQEETDYYYYTKRLLILTKDDDTRTVEHYQYTAWPDKSIPNHLPSLVKIRDKIKTFRESGKSPVVVHCSAGVGRTGTVIALDILLDQASAEDKIDIYKCVEKMRTQRTNLVQTLVQYIYLHDALNEILTVGSTVIPCDKLDSVIGSAEYDAKLTKQFEFLQSQSPCFNDEDMELGKFQNKDQNRDMNIIPADILRVKLPSSPETYINAVYVQGFRKNIGSVATQIPLPNTADVFWEMIYQLKCTTIVCLENSTDDNADWFQKKESQIVFDSLIITTTNVEMKDIMTKYNVTVGKYTENEYANVTQSETVVQDNIEVTVIELKDWSEKDLSERDIPQFLSVLKDVQQNTNTQGLSTVVCRNGATECGIYLASLWLLQMADKEKEVDVFYVVKQIRKTRPQFIPNKEQYLFLHDVVKSHAGT